MKNNVFSLSDDEVRALDLYWRAANYLGAAQIETEKNRGSYAARA
jgi:phosphoketolase